MAIDRTIYVGRRGAEIIVPDVNPVSAQFTVTVPDPVSPLCARTVTTPLRFELVEYWKYASALTPLGFTLACSVATVLETESAASVVTAGDTATAIVNAFSNHSPPRSVERTLTL